MRRRLSTIALDDVSNSFNRNPSFSRRREGRLALQDKEGNYHDFFFEECESSTWQPVTCPTSAGCMETFIEIDNDEIWICPKCGGKTFKFKDVWYWEQSKKETIGEIRPVPLKEESVPLSRILESFTSTFRTVMDQSNVIQTKATKKIKKAKKKKEVEPVKLKRKLNLD